METQSNNQQDDSWEVSIEYFTEDIPDVVSDRNEIELIGEIFFENEKINEDVYYDLFIYNLEKTKNISDLKEDCDFIQELYLYFLGMRVPEIEFLEMFFPKRNCKIFIQREKGYFEDSQN
jgi:hypothetical protein